MCGPSGLYYLQFLCHKFVSWRYGYHSLLFLFHHIRPNTWKPSRLSWKSLGRVGSQHRLGWPRCKALGKIHPSALPNICEAFLGHPQRITLSRKGHYPVSSTLDAPLIQITTMQLQRLEYAQEHSGFIPLLPSFGTDCMSPWIGLG